MKVYILQHEHELDDDTTDIKTIGIYRAEARSARERLSDASGFRGHRGGFSIDAYGLGQDHWADGFTTRSGGDAARTEIEAA